MAKKKIRTVKKHERKYVHLPYIYVWRFVGVCFVVLMFVWIYYVQNTLNLTFNNQVPIHIMLTMGLGTMWAGLIGLGIFLMLGIDYGDKDE